MAHEFCQENFQKGELPGCARCRVGQKSFIPKDLADPEEKRRIVPGNLNLRRIAAHERQLLFSVSPPNVSNQESTMLKKVIIGSLAATLVAGFIFGRDMFSYASTACDTVRQAVKSEISPEFELDRIRKQITQLMPEIRKHMTVVAEQSVDVKDLKRTIASKESRLAIKRDEIMARRDELASGKDGFTYRAVSYSRREAESLLANKFASFRIGEDALGRERQILDSKQQTLRANQKKLNSMLDRKETLAVSVSQLEARLKTIQATEAVHQVEIDDTELSNVEDAINALNHDLDVRESLLEIEGHSLDQLNLDEMDVELEDYTDVLSQIDTHFGTDHSEAVAEASHTSL